MCLLLTSNDNHLLQRWQVIVVRNHGKRRVKSGPRSNTYTISRVTSIIQSKSIIFQKSFNDFLQNCSFSVTYSIISIIYLYNACKIIHCTNLLIFFNNFSYVFCSKQVCLLCCVILCTVRSSGWQDFYNCNCNPSRVNFASCRHSESTIKRFPHIVHESQHLS